VFRPLFALALLAACSPDSDALDHVALDWRQGDIFHVGASYRVANVRNAEKAPASLDAAADPAFDEHWSPEIVWAYQVVETGLVPSPTDDLHDYALRVDGSVASLAVVRAWVDRDLNAENDLLSVDPVVYLVFREDRQRLAAIIQYTTVAGARTERAWSSKELGRSWSALSQSMLTAAPTYLAPFGAPNGDAEIVLENGSLLTTTLTDDGEVEAEFADELGGGRVVTRYAPGASWPVMTRTDNVTARLLDADELGRRWGGMVPPPNDPPPDYDFRAALTATIDVERALNIGDIVATEGYQAAAPNGYRPWAGAWWPLNQAELVFGWRGGRDHDTISDLFRDDLTPLKVELEKIEVELRDLEGAARNTKIAEYREKQGAYVDALVTRYNGVLQDLVGGRITVADGRIAHAADGWSFDIDELSPMDKYALHRYLDGQRSPNPFFLSAWELLNSWAADEDGDNGWFGHCNGWAAAAILESEPREPVTVRAADGTSFTYETADLKGLTSELHYNVYSRFYGARYNREGDDRADLHPKPFHQLITFYLRDQQVPLVFDTDSGAPVWNFPAWGADVTLFETTEGGVKVNINTATVAELAALPGIGGALAERTVAYREANGPFQRIEHIQRVSGIGRGKFTGVAELITVEAQQRTFMVEAEVRFTTDGVAPTHIDTDPNDPRGFTKRWGYTLTTDMHGLVVGGTWDDEAEHPDFAWIPYHNPTTAASGGGENPYIVYRDYFSKIVDLRRE
jgi:competence ComEA-like helix-hairpin-helix protein